MGKVRDNYCVLKLRSSIFFPQQGGFDSGYLYHCKFSKMQDEDPDKRKDEPFDFLRVDNSDNDPICSISFR